jgi:hypothetical protein
MSGGRVKSEREMSHLAEVLMEYERPSCRASDARRKMRGKGGCWWRAGFVGGGSGWSVVDARYMLFGFVELKIDTRGWIRLGFESSSELYLLI